MAKLPVTASHPHLEPSVGFNQRNDKKKVAGPARLLRHRSRAKRARVNATSCHALRNIEPASAVSR